MIDIIEKYKDSSLIAICENNDYLTYKKLNERVHNFFNFLKPSTVCLILGYNTSNTIAFYLACLKRECIPLILSPSISAIHLESYIDKYQPSYIFKEINVTNNRFIYDLKILKEKKIKAKHLPSLLLPTSGSTGNPKVVKITANNLSSNTIDIIKCLNIDCNSKHITTLPINYTYGLSCINTHLFSGATIVLNNSPVIQKDFWELMEQYKPNSISGVPYTYELLYRLGIDKINLKSIQTFTQAGGKLSNEILKYFADYCKNKNKEFIVMYGQTEATARMSFLPYRHLKKKIGSIGIAIPSGKFNLINTSNYKSISGYKVGELIYKGQNVSPGYSNSFLDLEIKGNKPNRLNTGDLAYIDKDGFTYICGRKSRFAKLNGIRISLDDIELCINKFIKSIVVSDDRLIYIFVESSSSISEVVKQKIHNSLSEFKIPRIFFKIKNIKTFPRASSGKIIYSNLL